MLRRKVKQGSIGAGINCSMTDILISVQDETDQDCRIVLTIEQAQTLINDINFFLGIIQAKGMV